MNAPVEYDLAELKVPPHSLEAEQSVLGGLLIAPKAWPSVAAILSADDFYRPDHRLIFHAVARVADTGADPDLITVSDDLASRDQLEQAGGFAYIAEIAGGTPSASNIKAYARAVRERAVQRQLIAAGNEIADRGFNPEGQGTDQLIDAAQSAVMALSGQVEHTQETTNQALRAVVEAIDERFQAGTEITGLPTGFADIDRRTRGLQRSDLILIAARPSMGKTTLAMNIAEHVAVHLRQRVLVFSMEMARRQLLERMTASAGHLSLRRVQSGQFEEDDWPKLTAGVSKLKDIPLVIDDRGGLSIEQIRGTARAHHQQQPLALIAVDYLQLARARAEGRTEEISEISRGLKGMAKELDIPVIALSQLNRKCEDRPNKRPRNADLRDGGSLEQDADLIAMLYRDEIYNEDSPDKGTAELIWTKYRNGATGTDRLAAQLWRARFEDLSPEWQPVANVTPMRKKRGGGFNYDE